MKRWFWAAMLVPGVAWGQTADDIFAADISPYQQLWIDADLVSACGLRSSVWHVDAITAIQIQIQQLSIKDLGSPQTSEMQDAFKNAQSVSKETPVTPSACAAVQSDGSQYQIDALIAKELNSNAPR